MADSVEQHSSIRRIRNYMQGVQSEAKLQPNYDSVVILSDSKGKYLKNQVAAVSNIADTTKLLFWVRSGRKTVDGVKFLEDKINASRPPFHDNGRTIVLFWHTTCDVTTLVRPHRFIRPSFDSSETLIASLKPSFDELIEMHNRYGFDIGFLEAPPVFPSVWNKSKDDPDWECFEDTSINRQIEMINLYFRNLNHELDFVSPKFTCDLMKFRKSGKSRKSFLSSDLFLDGIHPRECVSQKWLYQILKSVSRSIVW